MTGTRRDRPRVYAAHPVTSYGNEHAAECLVRLAGLLPGAELVDPEAHGWATDAAWRADWPGMLAGLAGLVVFTAGDGTVGTGCLAECVDALAAGIPVAGYDPAVGLVELAGFALLPAEVRTPRRAAWLAFGPCVDLARFPGGRPARQAVR